MIRENRRRFLQLVVATGTASLAGCSDSGGNETDSGGDATATEADTAADDGMATETTDGRDTTQTAENDETLTEGSRDLGDPDGVVGEIVPDGLDIVALNSRTGTESTVEGAWVTDVTVENTGDQQTEIDGYTYRLELRDDSGNELYDGFARELYPNDQPTEIGPGEQSMLITSAEPPDEVGPDEVGNYGVSITCELSADGVYCE